MKHLNTIYSELALIDKLVFKVCGAELTDLETDLESKEYLAHNFQLNGQNIKFRRAKITPKKTGQFVTIWKRNDKGITEPFDISDDIEFFIIATREDKNFGVFIFSKSVLYENNILSDKVKEGKRGIRVYPTWNVATSKQAQKTQLWQTKYFLDLSSLTSVDMRAKDLLNLQKLTETIR